MKVQLAKALWLKPRLLLLDEPTNHLDFEALSWLEEQIDEYPHTVVVVSHDVSFLHAVCGEILWIKDRKIEPLPRDALSPEDLARMQRTKPLHFRFAVPDDGPPQDHGVSVHNAEFSYPSESGGSQASSQALRVKGHVRFSGQSRAVMLGRNGSGKSTFLALCAGVLRPGKGSVDHTQGCKIGHYDQQMDEIDRCSELTAVEYLIHQCREPLEARMGVKARAAERSAERRGGKAFASTLYKQLAEIARGVLSGFGFDGELAIAVPVGRLSGGQKARLKLAVLSLRPAHILFLDEPTNHLDAEACEALAEGLSDFKGGIVVVTHDDLLIYRLIQCNWSRSELLTCHAGRVRCQKEFGGQCLKTLKEQVRRSEATGSCSAEMDPTSPRHSTKVAARASGSGPVQLPPWLASTSRRAVPRPQRRDTETASAADTSRKDQPDSPQLVPDCSSVATPARRRGREVVTRPGTPKDLVRKQEMAEKHHVQPRFTTTSARPSAPVVAQEQARPEPAALPNIPDRWDDDEVSA
jgi:ABC-type Mn2+/Zn2+ transport system ATPase subunit